MPIGKVGLAYLSGTEDDPIPVESAHVVVDISISEGVLVEPVPSVEVVSIEATIFAERKDSATTESPTEKFPTETDIIADTRISATNVPLGDVSAHRDYYPYAEAVPVEEKASVEEEVLEGLGSATRGTSAKAITPLKEGASPIGSQLEGTHFSTPLPVISLDDPFTSLP
nr:hypothetical protein CFP56_63613 [Quercus suber]